MIKGNQMDSSCMMLAWHSPQKKNPDERRIQVCKNTIKSRRFIGHSFGIQLRRLDRPDVVALRCKMGRLRI